MSMPARLCVLVAVVFFATALQADWIDDYRDGVDAVRRENWALAVEKLRAAARVEKAEGLQKFRREGRAMEDYLPFYYLGRALEKLGQNQEALAAYRESKRQGVLAQRPQTQLLLERSLRRLEELLATPTPVPPAPTQVPVEPTPIRIVPTPLSQAIEPPKPTAAPARERTLPPISQTPKPAALTKSTSPTPVPEDPAAIARASIREGIRSYFKGDFATAIARLEPEASKSPVARLFLAYTLASKYLVSSPQNPVELEKARNEFQKARGDGAGTLPDELISTRVRALLEGQ